MPSTDAAPFRTSDDAWLWAFAQLRVDRPRGPRPPLLPARTLAGRVVTVVNGLYHRGRITLWHAAVMHFYADEGRAPFPHEAADLRVWNDAMAALDHPLRCLGIVRDGAAVRLVDPAAPAGESPA